MMKKVKFIFLILVLIRSDVFSQTSTNEFYVAYGVLSAPFFMEVAKTIGSDMGTTIGDATSNNIFGSGTSDRIEHTSIQGYGPIILGYHRAFKNGLILGISAAYTYYHVNYTYRSGNRLQDQDRFISTIVSLDYTWFRHKALLLYSGIGIGISCCHSREMSGISSVEMNTSKYHFATQVNTLGIRFGETLNGFLEFGFGFNGLINGGLSVEF